MESLPKQQTDSVSLERRGIPWNYENPVTTDYNLPHLADETRAYFERLKQLADARRNNLESALEYYLFFNQADEVDSYLLDTLRVVSSDDVGRDEGSVQELIKKHEGVKDELESFERHIVQLQSHVETLPEEARAHPDIVSVLGAFGLLLYSGSYQNWAN